MPTRQRFIILMLLWLMWSPTTPAEDSNAKLIRVLSGRNETVRLRTIAALERDPPRKRRSLGDLISAVASQVKDIKADEIARPSTVRLIHLVGSVDSPQSEALLVQLLDAEHTGIAMLSADVLGKNKFYGAIEYLKKQVDRAEYASSYGFRFNLIRAFARMEHPDAVDFLTQLRSSFDGQLRYQIDEVLRDVIVGHFHGDEDRYAAWKRAAGDVGERESQNPENRDATFATSKLPKKNNVVFKTASAPESLERLRLGRPHQYYGIDIHAKRLMFIIDHSGSMKHYWGGMSRLEVAKNELVKAIRELPANSEFAIVFYHTNVNRWRDGLMLATEQNKLEAIAFVRKLGYGNRTNTYGALRVALEFDDSLEAVFLLTDGRPTAGSITSPPSIVTDILHRNQFRHLNFNTIGIALQPQTESFLKRLAEESNGEFRPL